MHGYAGNSNCSIIVRSLKPSSNHSTTRVCIFLPSLASIREPTENHASFPDSSQTGHIFGNVTFCFFELDNLHSILSVKLIHCSESH